MNRKIIGPGSIEYHSFIHTHNVVDYCQSAILRVYIAQLPKLLIDHTYKQGGGLCHLLT